MPAIFDVIIVGGGLAGSSLACALASANFGVLLLEREAAFRDRIRGEAIWPWGVAEIRNLALHDALMDTGAVELRTLSALANREIESTFNWDADAQTGFVHPALQETLFRRATAAGATALRPAKAISISRNGTTSTVRLLAKRGQTEFRTRLVVMADGKNSPGRAWTGGASQSDPVHHRFGGALVAGMTSDACTLFDATTPEVGVFWFPIAENRHRLYLALSDQQLRDSRADRSFEAYLDVARPYVPIGALDSAEQAGPFGFFPNSATWATRIASDGLVLIGDAAGSADPTNGQGCSLLFRDVRELRDLLLSESDWDRGIAEFARRRQGYFTVIHETDRWYNEITSGTGAEADARRERHKHAKDADPTLGGFRLIEERGPDGLIPDAAARAHYFGDDLP